MKLFALSTGVALSMALLASPVRALRNVTATVDLVGYNDVYEMLQDSVDGLNLGGPSRVIPIVKEMRAANPNSLVLFAGDTMSPSLWSLQFQGMQMVDAHNALGVDFACLGNHEFDFGIDAFLNVSEASHFAWLNANCFESNTGALLRGTVPRAVKTLSDPEFGTITIGFTGVMYDMKLPGNTLYWTDPIEAAREQVRILREEEDVDFVIALTHQGLEDDNKFSKEVEGVDLIMAGHDHAAMMQTNFGAPYLKADLDFRTIWQSRIEFFAADEEAKLPATSRMDHHLIKITEELPTDPDFDEVLDEYSAIIAELQQRVVGRLCEPFDLSQELVRSTDCPAGEVFADAAIHNYGPHFADVALINGGLIRSDKVYPAGDFTLGDLIAWSPFGNSLVVLETDGASMKKFMTAQMLASCGDHFVSQQGSYLQVGGIKYVFKCESVGVGALESVEWFGHPTNEGPVNDTDVLSVTMTNYFYNTNWAAVPDVVVSNMLVSEAEAVRIDAALEKFVKAQENQELCYKAEGRSSVIW